jgi:hypothetical protein
MSADLLFEDYKLKLDYLRGQYDRLWQRFNYFLGVELAVFGFLGYVTFSLDAPGAAPLPASIGLLVSAVWYVVGAQDRRLVEVYRERADDAAVRVGRHERGLPGFEHDHAAAGIPDGWRAVRSWYWSGLSITRLPATISLLLAAIWILVLARWEPMVRGLLPPATGR